MQSELSRQANLRPNWKRRSPYAAASEEAEGGSPHEKSVRWATELTVAGRDNGLELKNLIVWAKDNAGMGSFYRSKHELCFVFKNGEARHINTFELGQHGRHRTNVWDYAGVNTMRSGRLEELAMHPTTQNDF